VIGEKENGRRESVRSGGDDSDGTVDSSHPNDLGYYRMADALYPVLARLV
jgi:lysophospholipase L1-like esterase